jgi:PAS domain S-box-containing protein
MSADPGHFDHIEYTRPMEPKECLDTSMEYMQQLDAMVRELRQAQHAAEVAEARFRAVVEMAPDAIVIIDPEGHISLANHQTEDLFGYRRDELLGQSIELLVPERFRAVHSVHRAAFAADPHLRPMSTHLELFGRRADGTEFPVEINLGPMSVDGTNHVIATCRDITERRQLEQVLRDHAERLARTLEAMSEGVYIYDRAGQLVQMNAAGRALVEQDAQEPSVAYLPIQDPFQQYRIHDAEGRPLAPEDWPVVQILHGEIVSTTAPVELHILTLTGREQIASVTGGPLRDADGEVVGAVLVRRDVTQERRLELEVAARAHEIESIFDTDTDGLMSFDTQGRTIRMNAALFQLLGYEATGQADYMVPEERARGFAISDGAGQPLPQDQWPMYRVLRGETLTGPQAVEMRLRTLDGREIQVSVSGAPMVNEEGRIIGGVTSTRDVTAARELERQRTDILRVVAHDLANPVAAVKMYLQSQKRSLDRGRQHPPDAELLATLTQAVARMQRLLEDMRMVVGVEGHTLSLDMRPCDLVELCQQEVQAVQMATERAVRVELPSGAVRVDADRDRIGQVLANLLGNADKYSPVERPIALSLQVEPVTSSEAGEPNDPSQQVKDAGGAENTRQVRVMVRDEGPGIPLQQQAHLWERFHRVPGVQARPSSGGSLGFGLYISHEIVTAHGGAIGVESTPGQGSTFWFSLPVLTP